MNGWRREQWVGRAQYKSELEGELFEKSGEGTLGLGWRLFCFPAGCSGQTLWKEPEIPGWVQITDSATHRQGGTGPSTYPRLLSFCAGTGLLL